MHLRNLDRQLNLNRYPTLYYPEVYILHGGYSEFYLRYKSRCEPQNYVGMNDAGYRQHCAREMHNFRKTNRFPRTQSYTFGTRPVE